MHLLDLPFEILDSIVQHCYEPWTIQVRKLQVPNDIVWRLEIDGVPSDSLLRVCRPLYDLAKKIATQSFTGGLHIEERSSVIGLTCESFINSVQRGPRLDWIRQNVRTIRFTNPGSNPAKWKFHNRLYHFADFPSLKTVELDCRWPYHFAIHNVDSVENFLWRREGRLDRELDYRYSFFLSCEKFLHLTVCDGIAVTVIRAMGLRQGSGKCQAVVCLPPCFCQAQCLPCFTGCCRKLCRGQFGPAGPRLGQSQDRVSAHRWVAP